MIKLKQSKTADSRYCNSKEVTKEQLVESTKQHKCDVQSALVYFMDELYKKGYWHDWHKLETIDYFHKVFQNGMKDTGWLEDHYRSTRHHLNREGGVPKDVNLIDVLEYISDCCVAGLARGGKNNFYKPEISKELLHEAFNNTVKMLINDIELIEENK